MDTEKINEPNRYTFLVTSAINSRFGVFAPEQRLGDTLSTVESIKRRFPNGNVNIVVLEMCADELKPHQKAAILAQVTGLVEFGHEPEVKEIYKVESQDIVKNITEIVCCHKFFNYASNNLIFQDQKRIFKISGRYQLTEGFNIADYEDPELDRSIIFGSIRPSQFTPEITGNKPEENLQLMSRLWSFPATHIAFVRENYKKMGEDMMKQLNAGGYIDIEHLLYRHFYLNELLQISARSDTLGNTVIFEKVGLKGAIAPNGMLVED
jgi:hypothetical protein